MRDRQVCLSSNLKIFILCFLYYLVVLKKEKKISVMSACACFSRYSPSSSLGTITALAGYGSCGGGFYRVMDPEKVDVCREKLPDGRADS